MKAEVKAREAEMTSLAEQAGTLLDSIVRIAAKEVRASSTLRPMTSSVRTEVEAVEMEQPIAS